MTVISVDVFLKNTQEYINMAKTGTNVYIYLNDGTELKLQLFINK